MTADTSRPRSRRRAILSYLRRGRSRTVEPETIDRGESRRLRPVVGLALGGGAARGWAHIGVLEALLANGIVPEVIAGTSIGAVVGGCFAAGKFELLAAWARDLTRRRMFGLLDVSLAGGLVSGERLARLLEREVGNVNIETLPCVFAAVATELATGHEMWLTRGRLVPAMRASYALPGVFPPIRVGDRWLVDGALVDPVPVSAARALGARLVIAVNLNTDQLGGRGAVIPGFGTDQAAPAATPAPRLRARMFGQDRQTRRRALESQDGTPGLPTVMMEAFNVMQDRIARSRLAGDPPDIVIAPKVGAIGLFDFYRAEEAIAAGAEAVDAALPDIAAALAALA